MRPNVFRLLLLAVMIQLPVWILVGLNSLAFQVYNELAFSGAYFAGSFSGWWLYRSAYQTSGLAMLASTLLLTLYFWQAVVTGRPI